MTDKEKIAVLMKNLGITEDEARQVMNDDKEVDKGKPMPWDFTKEQEKAIRKYRQADRDLDKPTEKKPRTRKENPTKRDIIQKMETLMREMMDTVEVLNPEREILGEMDGVKYKITLSCPRK